MNNKIIIYQLLVRLAGNKVSTMKPWGSLAENGCGKFNDLNQSLLSGIKSLGCTHIWLTGVIEHASTTAYPGEGIQADNPLVIKGKAGSPYAIRDYFDVHPDLAVDVSNRMQEFESLLARCRENGLVPLMDFVPNHLARSYQSDQPEGLACQFGSSDQSDKHFDPQNNFYYIPGRKLELPPEVYALPVNNEAAPYEESPARATGNDCFSHKPSTNDWYETVKLNYGVDHQSGGQEHFNPVPDTWHKMLSVLRFWAGKGIGGFRCDMAEMVPVAFWEWVISRIRADFPEIMFIAEIYNPDVYKTYQEAGFDFLYDKVGLYDATRNILEGKQGASVISGVWQSLSGMDQYMLRFMENHDEQRIASTQFAKKAQAGIPAMTLAATMHKGPVMLYFGQELGEKAAGSTGFSGADGRTSIFDYCHLPTFQLWYNGGACNELQLDPEAKGLRAFYTHLLNLCHDPVVSGGHFYDIMWANPQQPMHYIYAYIRWTTEKAWLILANFNQHENIRTTLHIPDHFWEFSGHGKALLQSAQSILPAESITPPIKFKMSAHGFDLELPPYAAGIISMQKP